MIALIVCSLVTGYFFIIGAVYCTCPKLMLPLSVLGFGSWVIESDLAVRIVAQRTLDNLISRCIGDSGIQSLSSYWVTKNRETLISQMEGVSVDSVSILSCLHCNDILEWDNV